MTIRVCVIIVFLHQHILTKFFLRLPCFMLPFVISKNSRELEQVKVLITTASRAVWELNYLDIE